MGTSNDIVINARATTAQAEKDIGRLDEKIKTLSKTGTDNAKAYQLGFAAMQGSINGVITKLGAVGLAIGALKAAYDLAQKEQQRYIDAMKGAADASSKYFVTIKDQTKGILDNLEKLDKLAEGGYLDDAAIQQTNNLVSQLNDLWGDVGLSVDKATGKVTGLQDATKKINAELRAMALEQAKLEEQVAQSELDKANENYNWYFDANGNTRGAAGLLIAGNYTGEGVGAYRTELDNARKTAQAALLAVQARRKAIEGATTQEQINDTIRAAETAQKADATAQAEKIKTREQLTAAQGRIGSAPDWRLLNLQSELAMAQANGGDVTAAKNALDAYTRERDITRFNQLEGSMRAGVGTYQQRLAAYNQGIADNVDDSTLLQLATALNEITDQLAKDAEEYNMLGARLEQPQTPIEEPQTQAAEIVKKISRGTFDAFGLGGLSGGNIQQQQLDVQKQIERNTQQLAVPVVGE